MIVGLHNISITYGMDQINYVCFHLTEFYCCLLDFKYPAKAAKVIVISGLFEGFAPGLIQDCLLIIKNSVHICTRGAEHKVNKLSFTPDVTILDDNFITFIYSLDYFCLRCNTESEWSQIHENIIKKANSRYNLSGSNTGKNLMFFNPSCFLKRFSNDTTRILC